MKATKTLRHTLIGLAAATLLLGCASQSALAERQPAMDAALGHLLAAERALLRASPDKGGHRARALELVRRAIVQVRKGKRFDNRH